MVRRFTVTATAGQLWKLVGVRGLEGDNETATVEVFQGIGFASRPPASGKSEAIVVNVGGARAPVIVAVRDEKTYAALRAAGIDINAGETVIYNSDTGGVVYLRANGTVEIRSPGGTAGALALEANLVALRAAIQGAVIVPNDGGAALKAAILAASWTTGTTVLKAE
jgi:phage gp45-like